MVPQVFSGSIRQVVRCAERQYLVIRYVKSTVDVLNLFVESLNANYACKYFKPFVCSVHGSFFVALAGHSNSRQSRHLHLRRWYEERLECVSQARRTPQLFQSRWRRCVDSNKPRYTNVSYTSLYSYIRQRRIVHHLRCFSARELYFDRLMLQK